MIVYSAHYSPLDHIMIRLNTIVCPDSLLCFPCFQRGSFNACAQPEIASETTKSHVKHRACAMFSMFRKSWRNQTMKHPHHLLDSGQECHQLYAAASMILRPFCVRIEGRTRTQELGQCSCVARTKIGVIVVFCPRHPHGFKNGRVRFSSLLITSSII